MHSNTMRMCLRFFGTAICACLISAIAVVQPQPAGAITVLSGRVSTTGDVVPRQTISLVSAFVSVPNTGTYVYSTEVRDSAGKRVARWSETLYATAGKSLARTYKWNTATVPDGIYAFRQSVATRAGTRIAENVNAGSFDLAPWEWTITGASQTSSMGSTFNANYAAPSNALGPYRLTLELYSNAGERVGQWTQDVNVGATRTWALNASVKTGELQPGEYILAGGAFASEWVINRGWEDVAYPVVKEPQLLNQVQPVSATVPTTTTIPKTTTTTTAPVPTTTTTTTLAPAPTTTTTTTAPTTPWSLLFSDDFNTDVAEGSFLSKYGTKWDAYPTDARDTSKKGQYNPGIISVSGGLMNMRLHTVNGVPQVAAPIPLINGSNGDINQTYGRYEIRFRADAVSNYKAAWLLWPKSEIWPLDGEIDFPEGDLDGTMSAFMHHQGGTSGGDQDAFDTAYRYDAWHTAVIEWMPNRVNFIIDGKTVGSSTTRIPNTPMHWVIQSETSLGSAYPDANAVANIQVDYVKVWKYTP